MIKRILLLGIISIAACVSAGAQTLHGAVRTIARPDKESEPVPGVVIRLKGYPNAVITQDNGCFDAVLVGKTEGDAVYFQSVRKNGYELRDAGFLNRPAVFSSTVGIEIVMVDLEQLERDKIRIENNAYRVAEQNYRKKLAELEDQKLGSEITAEKHREELARLQSNYEKYISLIGEMADRYARSDYQNMDSIDYRINKCIEDGELELADSLIHTVFDPNTVLERNRAAKEEIRKRMEFAQAVIDRARADIAAIERDREYALRAARLGETLAEEYLLEGKTAKAIECLEKSLEIIILIYGDDSEEANSLKSKITQLRETL